MRTLLAATIAAVLVSSSVASLSAQRQRPQFHGEGCVEPGVEASCLLVKDVKTDAIYALFIKGVQPAIGSGIEFTGLSHRGVTTCMQGKPVDVLTWAHKDLKCLHGTAPKPRK